MVCTLSAAAALRAACGCRDGGLHARGEIAGGKDSGNGCLSTHGSYLHESVAVERDAQRSHELPLELRRMREEHLARDTALSREFYRLQELVARDQTMLILLG